MGEGTPVLAYLHSYNALVNIPTPAASRSIKPFLCHFVTLDPIDSFVKYKLILYYQLFFQRYLYLSGMTGTAREVRGEIWSIYKLRVIEVPSHRPVQRIFLPAIVVRSDAEKWQCVIRQVAAMHATGRPVLLGTRTVAASEQASELLNFQHGGLIINNLLNPPVILASKKNHDYP